jgi:hypothetical protein
VPSEVEVVEPEVRRLEDAARVAGEVRRDPEAHRGDTVLEQRLDRGIESGDDVLLRRRRAFDLDGAEDVPVPVDDAGEDLGAADVDSDDVGCSHGRAQPYRAAQVAPRPSRP